MWILTVGAETWFSAGWQLPRQEACQSTRDSELFYQMDIPESTPKNKKGIICKLHLMVMRIKLFLMALMGLSRTALEKEILK